MILAQFFYSWEPLLPRIECLITYGADIIDAGYLGSMAAAIQVGRVGNMSFRVNELLDSLNNHCYN